MIANSVTLMRLFWAWDVMCSKDAIGKSMLLAAFTIRPTYWLDSTRPPMTSRFAYHFAEERETALQYIQKKNSAVSKL